MHKRSKMVKNKLKLTFFLQDVWKPVLYILKKQCICSLHDWCQTCNLHVHFTFYVGHIKVPGAWAPFVNDSSFILKGVILFGCYSTVWSSDVCVHLISFILSDCKLYFLWHLWVFDSWSYFMVILPMSFSSANLCFGSCLISWFDFW